jgi:hypothetical protein
VLLLVFFASIAFGANAGTRAEDFTVFIKHFRRDRTFRESRIRFPLPVDLSSTCEEEPGRSKARWGRAEFRKSFVVPQERAALSAEGLDRQLTERSATEIQLFQFRPEADSYLVTYTFRLRSGRWFLVGYEDGSC